MAKEARPEMSIVTKRSKPKMATRANNPISNGVLKLYFAGGAHRLAKSEVVVVLTEELVEPIPPNPPKPLDPNASPPPVWEEWILPVVFEVPFW